MACIGLCIRVKMIGRGRSLLRDNLADIDPPASKTYADFESIFSRSASAVTPSKQETHQEMR